MRRLRYLCRGTNSLGQMANPKMYTYACTYVSWQDSFQTTVQGNMLSNIPEHPSRLIPQERLQIRLSTARFLPSLNNFCDGQCADGNLYDDNDDGDRSLDLCGRTNDLIACLLFYSKFLVAYILIVFSQSVKTFKRKPFLSKKSKKIIMPIGHIIKFM